MEEVQAKLEEEQEWWEARKKGIQDGFMKELDGGEEVKTAPKTGSDDEPVLVEAGGPAGAQGSIKKRKGKK